MKKIDSNETAKVTTSRVYNADIAAIFDEIANLLEIKNANPFRIRAYRNAARNIANLTLDLPELCKAETAFPKLPGIGNDLCAKIHEIAASGHCALLDELRTTVPDITALLTVPGLGPKRVQELYQQLSIKTLEQLYEAALAGRISMLSGFGKKTERQILHALAKHIGKKKRIKLVSAEQYARPLLAYLQTIAEVKTVSIAGSYRRVKETVGDLDIVAAAANTEAVIHKFAQYDAIEEILSAGSTRSSVLLRGGLQVDLRVVAPSLFGAALLYFTGSKSHNIALRRIAQEQGCKLNEYGLFRAGKRIAGETEESIYIALGFSYIPPELRENCGELEMAHTGPLPKLIECSDLKGDLHTHTKATDGTATIREMALAAWEHGLTYLAITDHSQRLAMTHGLDVKRLAEQIKEIDWLNRELVSIRILKGIEVDILKDGSLDLPHDILAQLDIVIGAIHHKFDLPQEEQTTRIMRALEHPYLTILAHPGGRLIGQREPYKVDMLRIIKKAKACGCFLELNAQPERLDLVETYCQAAKAEGVLVSINSDAHSVFDFEYLRFGINQARRGWLEKENVLNTRSFEELLLLIKNKKTI